MQRIRKEYKIADTNKYRENAKAEFDILYTEAKSMYAEDDVVSIVQYIQNGMVSCFANINKEYCSIYSKWNGRLL